MTRRPLGGRTAHVIPCACGGAGRMALVSVLGMRATGVTRCPHCAEHPRDSIEIRTYRMRVDTPRHEHEDEIA